MNYFAWLFIRVLCLRMFLLFRRSVTNACKRSHSLWIMSSNHLARIRLSESSFMAKCTWQTSAETLTLEKLERWWIMCNLSSSSSCFLFIFFLPGFFTDEQEQFTIHTIVFYKFFATELLVLEFLGLQRYNLHLR